MTMMIKVLYVPGFQLWLAENKTTLAHEKGLEDDTEVQTAGLEIWKGMSKEDKEGYKTPRLPTLKRKREESTESTASKLAKFAAPSV